MYRALRGNANGKITLGSLIVFLLLAAIVYSAIRLIPVYARGYQLIDFADEIARFPGRRTEKDIAREIVQKAQELGIQLDARNLEIRLAPNETRIRISFDMPTGLPFYEKKHFEATKTYPRF